MAIRSVRSLLGPGLLLAGASVALWASSVSRDPAVRRACPAEEYSLPLAKTCSLAVSPDGAMTATGARDGVVWVWDNQARRQVGRWQAHEEKVTALAFSPARRELFTSGAHVVRQWSLDEGAPHLAGSWTYAAVITALAVAPDGQALAVASPRRLELRDPGCSEPLWEETLSVPSAPIRALAFAPAGDALAAAGAGDHAVRVWALGGRGPVLRLTLQGHPDNWVRGLAYTPDGGTLVSLDTEGLAVAWDRDGNLLGRTHTGLPTCLHSAIGGGGRLVLTADTAGRARLLRFSEDWWH